MKVMPPLQEQTGDGACSIQVVQDQHTWLYHHQGAATIQWYNLKNIFYVNLVVRDEIVDGRAFF